MGKGICNQRPARYWFIYFISGLSVLSGSQISDQPSMGYLTMEPFLSESLRNADISLSMSEGDQELFSYRSEASLIPASNTKLFITAAALLSDSTEHIFPPLQSYADGSIEEGSVLNGNLILDSCASLIFSARFIDDDFESKNRLLAEQVSDYCKQLRTAGIKTINGDIKLSFERWNGSPENRHYAPASAFSFNENTVDTLVENGILKTVPKDPLIFRFKSTQEVKDQDLSENNQVSYNPKVDSEDFWRISNVSANEYALSMFKRELRKHGINILEHSIHSTQSKKLLFETPTNLLTDKFIKPLNTFSDNFRAEILARLLVRAREGSAEYTFLNNTIHKIFADSHLSLESLKVHDGSGLSRSNRASAADINKLLQFMEKQASFDSFKDSMAIAGRAGTLKERFKGTAWENSFYGKTGTLNGVSALSGYWLRDGKPTITFAFIGNGADTKDFWKALEKFAASLKHSM